MDEDWLVLTQDMEPYDPFRFIVRHVLDAALQDARGYATDERQDARSYATDERLFGDGDPGDPQALRAHLDELDRRRKADEELRRLEADVLCAVVQAALQDVGQRSRRYGHVLDLAELARDSDPDPGSPGKRAIPDRPPRAR